MWYNASMRIMRSVVAVIIGGSAFAAGTTVFVPYIDERTAISSSPEIHSEATILFVGDMMFDRYIRTRLGTHGADHVLGAVAPLMQSADAVVGNLEGPITDNPSVSVGSQVGDLTNMRFTFAPEIAPMLASYGVTAVSLGNNHILDFGEAGVRSTTEYLHAAGVVFVGDPTGRYPEPRILSVNGIDVALVSYSDFVAGDADRARRALASDAATRADAVVLLAHWDAEYEHDPSPRVRDLAHSFVTAGADLIIGTHSHVIGATEDWNGTRIYYSLGNFVFDQYFSAAVRCGRAVRVTVTKTEQDTSFGFEEVPIGMERDGSTMLGCSP